MRNYQREYIQRNCRELVELVGNINRKHRSNEQLINVEYGRRGYCRYNGIELMSSTDDCAIDTVRICLDDDDYGFELAVEGRNFYGTYYVGYNCGNFARWLVKEYIKQWCKLVESKANKNQVSRYRWINDFCNLVKSLNDVTGC